MNAGDVRLDAPAQIRLRAKGKLRAVPLMEAMVQLLGDHLHEKGLEGPEHVDRPLFPEQARQSIIACRCSLYLAQVCPGSAQ